MNTNPGGETRPSAPRHTANPAPPRPAGSVRRTTSIDVEWLDGINGPRRMHGRARDYRTSAAGMPGEILASAEMTATLTADKLITDLAAHPAPARLAELVGQRGGGHLRMLMGEIMPELIATGDPLYLLLDDISGVALICNWGWALWEENWLVRMNEAVPPEQLAQMMNDRAGVCHGLQHGHSGMSMPDSRPEVGTADGGELRNPADPEGWHAFPVIPRVSMRRARRIDVSRGADGQIHIDAAFQDSAPRPDGTRAALHEYRIAATADPETLVLTSLEPEARVLPFHECPGVIPNAKKMVGKPLADIRRAVLAELRGTAGCTHLNDALRALAEVPGLVRKLG